jgi:lipoate-protein ligase A
MALDHALMDFAQRSGTCVFRVYEWSTPTLSLGRNQTARGGYDLARLAELGIPVVRRPTGGRAILHHREITYAVAAPENALGALRESYERINRLLLAGCRALGVAAEVATSASRTAAPGLAPCFASPSAGELMLAGRKLAGSAQFRRDGALLQHGSILVDNDQDLLPSLLLEPAPPTPTPATLHDALGRIPAPDEVAGVLFDAVRTLEDPGAESFVPDDALKAAAHSLLTHYTDDAWTWRR